MHATKNYRKVTILGENITYVGYVSGLFSRLFAKKFLLLI